MKSENAEELIDYKEINQPPIRIAHAVDSIATVHDIEETIENGDVAHVEDSLKSQIRKRKQIMTGLDEEIEKLEEIIEEEGENR